MTMSDQKLWLLLGFIALNIFGLTFWQVAQLLPPPSPSETAQEIAAFYQVNKNGIRAGISICLFVSVFFYPIYVVIFAQMRRIEKANGLPPVNSVIQLFSGVVAYILAFVFPFILWGVVSFRPDRMPDLMLLFSDMGWIMASMLIFPFFLQALAITFLTFADKKENPLFPRWLGWFGIWVMLGNLPGTVVLFFKTGPFAYNGFFAFWIPFIVACIFFLVMFWVLLKAINNESYDDSTI